MDVYVLCVWGFINKVICVSGDVLIFDIECYLNFWLIGFYCLSDGWLKVFEYFVWKLIIEWELD